VGPERTSTGTVINAAQALRPEPLPEPEPPRPKQPASLEVEVEMKRFRTAGPMREAIERGPVDPDLPRHPEPAPVMLGGRDEDDYDPYAESRRRDPRRAPPNEAFVPAPAVAAAVPTPAYDDRYDPRYMQEPERPPQMRPATEPPQHDRTESEPAFPARPGGFPEALLGDLDEGDDEEEWDGGDLDGVEPSRAPLPWLPILGGAALLVALGVFLFRDALFGGDEGEGDVAADAADSEGADDATDETKETKEATPAADTGGDAATGGTGGDAGTGGSGDESGDAAAPATAAKLDEATIAKLDEARDIYAGAGGSSKKLKAAGELLDQVLAIAPNHPEALLIKAQVQLESGKLDEALTTATLCTAISAELADCWLTIGVVQQNNKNKDAAVAAYEKYVALAPEGKYASDARTQLSRLK
jgi:hypothetical protein